MLIVSESVVGVYVQLQKRRLGRRRIMSWMQAREPPTNRLRVRHPPAAPMLSLVKMPDADQTSRPGIGEALGRGEFRISLGTQNLRRQNFYIPRQPGRWTASPLRREAVQRSLTISTSLPLPAYDISRS